jgi:asparagine synthase (glutamine-hydrolysing)
VCGIAGLVRFYHPLASDAARILDRMTDELSSRGPDGRGTWVEGSVAFGHRRLSIIDLATGSQPLLSTDSRFVVTYNGEIYNFQELRDELEKLGSIFCTRSDTEVIVEAFRQWGVNSFEKLRGIFAFALFDRERHELFLARDPCGVKPLYYSLSATGISFASELRAFRHIPEFSRDIDLTSLSYYLTMDYVPSPRTIHPTVRKLEAGRYFRITLKHPSSTPTTTSYRRSEPLTILSKLTFSEAVDRVDDALRSAVVEQKIADVPLGAFLSGGIDSTLVTAYLAESMSKPLRTFSVTFEESSYDESEFASLVARQLGTEHHEVRFGEAELPRLIEKVFSKMDEPLADASILPTTLLCEVAKTSVTVALSGDGSDEIFGGYPTYAIRERVDRIPSALFKAMKPVVGFLPKSEGNMSLEFKFRQLFKGGTEQDRDLRHAFWMGSIEPDAQRKLFKSGTCPAYDADNRFQIIRDAMSQANGIRGWERSLYQDFRFYLQDGVITKVDRASMWNGLEVRVPFLDPRVVDLARQLPADYKYSPQGSKRVLRELVARKFPETISRRPKKGLGIPVAKWLRGCLKKDLLEVCHPALIEKQGVFNPKIVGEWVDAHLSGRADYRKELWNLFVWQMWRKNQDR